LGINNKFGRGTAAQAPYIGSWPLVWRWAAAASSDPTGRGASNKEKRLWEIDRGPGWLHYFSVVISETDPCEKMFTWYQCCTESKITKHCTFQ